MSRSEREWNDAYGEAMQWRDWQTCEQLLAERDNIVRTKRSQRRFRHIHGFRLWVRFRGKWYGTP